MIGLNQFEFHGTAVSPVQNYTYKNGNGQYGVFYIEVPEGEKKNMYGITLFGKSYEKYANKVNKGDEVYVRGRITSSQFTSRNGDRKLSYSLAASWVESESNGTTEVAGQTFDTGADLGIDPNDLPF